MNSIRCQQCNFEYPDNGVPYLCPSCGGIFDRTELPEIDLKEVEPISGIWRYRHSFAISPNGSANVTLGEGATPLIQDQAFGISVLLKLESLNPTGSYKDRATSVLTSFLVERGVASAVEDSSGNAGASFAAYAARAGIKARVYIPATASGPKRAQIEMFGADLVPVIGPRSAAAEAVRKAAKSGEVYASHAFLPFGLDGIATNAFEIFESLGEIPGSIIAPVGHGSLLLGVARGFEALQSCGWTKDMPQIIGVQAAACAPVWCRWVGNTRDEVMEADTIAEGVRVLNPVRAEPLLQTIQKSDGQVVSVEEHKILPARDQLANRGVYVEPTSAIVWAAVELLKDRIKEPAVLLITGTGYKYNA